MRVGREREKVGGREGGRKRGRENKREGERRRTSFFCFYLQLLLFSLFPALPSISLPLTKTTLSLTTQQSISFSCEAHGTPNLTVSWFHNHTPILQTSGRTLNTKYSINSSATADQNSILSVLSITEELGLIDSGEVRCVFGISFLDDDRVMQTPNDESSASLTVLGECECDCECECECVCVCV